MGKGLTAVLLNISVFFYLAVFLFYLNYSVQNDVTFCFKFDFKPTDRYLDKVWRNLALFLGGYLFLCVVSVGLTRANTVKIVPYIGQEPRLAVVLNRIISNTIEQSAIFGCLLYGVSASSSNQLGGWPETHFGQLVRIFIFGRCLFGVGYLLGDLLNAPFLRSFGFALNFFSSGTLLLKCFGVDLFQIASKIPFDL